MREEPTDTRADRKRRDLKIVLILTGIYVLAISTLLRAHVLYKDDIGRAVEGYLRWAKSSRYVSDLLAVLIQGGVSLTDQSPLQQLIAALFMAAASLITVRALCPVAGKLSVHKVSPVNGSDLTQGTVQGRNGERKEQSGDSTGSCLDSKDRTGFVKYLAALGMGLNPYFLECFSFQFDAAFMAFSVLVAVFPFFIGPRRRKAFLTATLICTLLVMMSYQASSGIFPILVLFYALLRWTDRELEGKPALALIGQSAAVYLAALAIFRLFFMHNSSEYNSGEMIPFSRLLPGLAVNYRKLAWCLWHDFSMYWKLLFLAVILLFFVMVLWTSQRNRIVTFAALAAVVVMSFLLSNGVLIMVEKLRGTRRAAYGFFMILSFMMIVVAVRDRIYAGKVVCILVFWTYFAFAFTYGNAVAENDRWIGSRLEMAACDLNALDLMQTDTRKQIQLAGEIPPNEELERLGKVYPVLQFTLPPGRANYQWNRYRLLHCYGLKNVYTDKKNDLRKANLPLLLDTMAYEIYGDEGHVLIVFG